MFLGPLEQSKPWDTSGIEGLYRFLRRSHRLVFEQPVEDREPTADEARLLHQTIRKVTADIESLSLNTAISQMMIFLNGFAGENKSVPREAAEAYTIMLSPFAPHLGEEMWEKLRKNSPPTAHLPPLPRGISDVPWPEFDESKTKVSEIEILVQVAGKPRARIMMSADATQDAMRDIALANPDVRAALEGKPVRKVIAVPGRLVNIVA